MANAALQFEINPHSGVPIYRQLMEQVRALIASRHLQPGDMLPSVRQMAMDLQVNMMTVSKAYARLEADGVLERARGQGMIVPEVAEPKGGRTSVAQRQSELRELIDPLVTRGFQLGLTDEQIVTAVRGVLKDRRRSS